MRLLSTKSCFIILGLAFCQPLFAEQFYNAPNCPKEIRVQKGIVSGNEEWAIFVSKKFISSTDNINIPDGTLLTEGKAPSIAIIRDTNPEPILISANIENYESKHDEFIWNEKTFELSSKKVFLCNASGTSSTTPRPFIKLYVAVPEKTVACNKIFSLINGKRSWDSQQMQCYL